MFYGFCGVFFFIPVATSPAVILGIATLSLYIVSGRFFEDCREWTGRRWFAPALLIVVLSWAGLLYTPDFEQGLVYATKTYYWLYALAIAGFALSPKRQEAFIKAFIAGLTFTSVLFILQLWGIVPMDNPYTIGLFSKWAHITLSLLMTTGIMIMSFYYRNATSPRLKVLCLAVMELQFVALAFMLSDSGHLAFILFSPVIMYNVLGGRRSLKVLAASAAIVGVLFISPITQSRLFQVFAETEAYAGAEVLDNAGGVDGRYYMWTGALRIFARHPLLGVGTGGYTEEMDRMKPVGSVLEVAHPHNDFLHMGVSYGILGVIALAWLYIILLRDGWRRRNTVEGFSLLSFTMVLLVGSLTATQAMSTATGMLLAMFLGLNGRKEEGLPKTDD
ncbi:MAG: O-antigen ligase family protein [Nitrospirota bacterium]|jgi:O-antigen ligase